SLSPAPHPRSGPKIPQFPLTTSRAEANPPKRIGLPSPTAYLPAGSVGLNFGGASLIKFAFIPVKAAAWSCARCTAPPAGEPSPTAWAARCRTKRLAGLVSATVVAIAIANLLMLTLSEHLVAAVVPLLDVLSGVSRHPVAEFVDEDLHHYPHSVDQRFQSGRHHGRPSTSSNRSLLTASVMSFTAISPMLRFEN